jgi:hypothetical protein
VAGGSYTAVLALGLSPAVPISADAFVQGRAAAFALAAGRRISAGAFLDDGNLVIGGDEAIALAVLEHLRAFVE